MKRGKSGFPINALLLLDKDAGHSSNTAVQRAKRILSARKAGHTGSLDPIATGVLPLCLGEATKLAAFLLDTDKRYYVRIRLGVTTTTADIEGQVVQTQPVPQLAPVLLETCLSHFRGPIQQVPPMYSALKHQGQRLYDLARKGEVVDRPPRAIVIHELNLLEFGRDFVDLDVHCSKGTYIRSLAVDIGERLGCGGHVEILRRTAVGRFKVEDAVTLAALENSPPETRSTLLMPMDVMVDHFPSIFLNQEAEAAFNQGQTVKVASSEYEGLVRVYDQEKRLIGLGAQALNDQVKPKRVFCNHA